MHELSLARAVWTQVEAELLRRPGARLVALHLVVGRLSGADPESLAFALDLVTEGADDAKPRVDVRTEPAALQCDACGHAWETGEFSIRCPACGSADVDVTAGRDVRLESLELEKPDD